MTKLQELMDWYMSATPSEQTSMIFIKMQKLRLQEIEEEIAELKAKML